jgi:4-hydroxythreonine-4-phosphate dehydrogenase
MGDPAGIGPDLALAAWSLLSPHNGPAFFVLGDAAVLRGRAALLAELTSIPVEEIAKPEEALSAFSRALPVLQVEPRCPAAIPGKPDVAHAPAIIAAIEKAVSLTLDGSSGALVTGPISKHVLLRYGFPHAGHTEFLGALAKRHGSADAYPVMLMASKRLMAVPVTVHIPLKDVPAAVSESRLLRVAQVTSDGLSHYFGIARPRLAFCGLNPHAGENGEIGLEEREVIAPAIQKLNRQGILASGPYPADTLFHEAARGHYDAVLAMYHDQALIPFKTLSFEDGVNVTLGLPFIRTSPDHGTAFSLAGTGRADPSSFVEALHLARRMYDTKSR